MKRGMHKKKRTIIICLLIVSILLVFQFVILPVRENSADKGQNVYIEPPTTETEAASESTSAKSEVDKASQYLILVNKTHSIDKDYIPGDLVQLKHTAKRGNSEYQKLRKVAADAFERLAIEAEEAGHTISATTAYRSYKYQKQLYESYKKIDKVKKVSQYSAKPGYSEHQTGLAVDVSAASVNYELKTLLGQKPEGKWIKNNAHRYGFIVRYPQGKKHITGYEYEPWHLRYVGRDAAREIYEGKVTLEEYLGETE